MRSIVHVGVASSGIRANVSLSAPAIARRMRCPFLNSTEVGCMPIAISADSPGTMGAASFDWYEGLA